MKLYEFYYKEYDDPKCNVKGKYLMRLTAITTSKKDAKAYMKQRKYDKDSKKSMFVLRVLDDVTKEDIMKASIKYAGKVLYKTVLYTKSGPTDHDEVELVITKDEDDILEMIRNGEYVQWDGFNLYDTTFWIGYPDPTIYDEKFYNALVDVSMVPLQYLHGPGYFDVSERVEFAIDNLDVELADYDIFMNEFGFMMRGYE